MKPFITLFSLLICISALHAQDRVLPIPNGDFENRLDGWTIADGESMSSLSEAEAATGHYALEIRDTSSTEGSNITSKRIAIQGAGAYEVRGKYNALSGSGLGVYVHIFNQAGEEIGDEAHRGGLGGNDHQWREFEFPFYTPDEAAFLDVHFHSYNGAHVHAFLDDIAIVQIDPNAKPPWKGQYKIRPEETDRLTPADIVGPDGIVYPNWTHTGVQGGIPDIPAVVHIADFGGYPNDGKDDTEALNRACIAAGQKGGGAVQLDTGVYHLDRPVTVQQSGIVIRGQGPQTQIVFRYAIPKSGITFYNPAPNSRIGRNTRIELHAQPTELERMTITIDDRIVAVWSRSQHSGNSFSVARYGRHIPNSIPDGAHTLTGIARYHDGTVRKTAIPIILDRTFNDTTQLASSRAAITFQGTGTVDPRVPLTRDGARGDTLLIVQSAKAFAVGDPILIDGPATDRWKALTKNACQWGTYRRYLTRITAIHGDTLTIEQPLRIEFPIIDGSWVQKFDPISQCGVENLSIEQTENLWITTVLFSNAWNCWARGVTVKMCGRHAVYADMAKWCEIRNCIFDDAWFKGGGGTAYVGWERTWDSLMENVTTYKMRHAPLFQWAAAGCVIRNSTFHDSDAQWHSGWTHENLIENCTITSVRGNGGYGYGMWASPPEDTAHGPNGPRNVVYNNDISSVRAGIWIGGMDENWLFLHNRFIVDQGPGFFTKTASFDHILRDNVFVLKDQKSPMAFLATPDCIGIELIDNQLFGGNGRFASGAAKPSVLQNNAHRADIHPLPSCPTPDVPSIYEWQQKNVK